MRDYGLQIITVVDYRPIIVKCSMFKLLQLGILPHPELSSSIYQFTN